MAKGTASTARRKGDEELQALKEIQAWLARNARSLSDVDREFAEGDAFDRWFRERKASPATYAKRARDDVARKTKRRGTASDLDAVNEAAGRGRTVLDILAHDPPQPKERDRRYKAQEIEQLQQAVRLECLRNCSDLFGAEPRLSVVQRLAKKAKVGVAEQRARAAFIRLREAMLEVDALTRRSQMRLSGGSHSGQCLGFLAHWVPEHITPLLEHAALAADPSGETETWTLWDQAKKEAYTRKVSIPRWSKIPASPRDVFAREVRSKNVLNVPKAAAGKLRGLKALELAWIWLAAGGWPDLREWGEGRTVGKIIDIERQAFDGVLSRSKG